MSEFRYITINGVEMRQLPKFSRYAVNRLGLIWDMETQWFVLSDLTAEGYATVRLRRDDGKWGRVYCHEFVAKAWLENPKRRKAVRHKSLITTDNSPENLEFVAGPAMGLVYGLRNRAVLSADTRIAMRDSKIGVLNPMFKGVYVTDLGRFNSLEDAGAAHGVHKTTMMRRFKNGTNGYVFIEK